jgi:hypothetical protein
MQRSFGSFGDSVSFIDPRQLTDRELIRRCSELGRIAAKSRRMFVGLLPLVERRRAYDVKRFSSIYHFAAVVGGVTHEITEEVLRLDVQLSRYPLLQTALYSGEIGWSKIRAVISRVTTENQKVWLGLLRSLPKEALAVYLRDFRKQEVAERMKLFPNSSFPGESAIGLQKCDSSQAASSGEEGQAADALEHTGTGLVQPADVLECVPNTSRLEQLSSQREVFAFPVCSSTSAQLRLFRQKLERRVEKMVTWDDVLVELLRRAKED